MSPPDPPTPDVPYWRDDAGLRTTVAAVLAGRDVEERRRLLALHTAAVAQLVRAAADESLHGRSARVRALATHASRLCGELAGLWPVGSDRPLQ